MIDVLVKYSPYPLYWYETRSDKQISAMYRNHLERRREQRSADKKAAHDYAIKRAEEMEASRVKEMLAPHLARIEQIQTDGPPAIETRRRIIGEYHITVINRRSIRFQFIHMNGRVDNAIVSRLSLTGFTLESSSDSLPPRHLCLAWESGKKLVMTVDQLVAKILGSATNNPRELVQELYRITNTKRQSKSAV
ncbi:hypothetical protein ACK8P5_25900 (plasmid) [Paenibacillus sp. EC2-1]|uniref:hypothetical protein n=1 Tax=Paenibacillus sp. EC2-1 TaxID=3388665 RepID=UPI003BEEEE92